MEKIDLNDAAKVAGGAAEENAAENTFICRNPDHMNHNICCGCGWEAQHEGERTYCRKYRIEKGGDGKYHYFCRNCINELGLN